MRKSKARTDESAPSMIFGLTGGIGSGKSAAARFFADAGFAVIDADAVARALRAPGGEAEPLIRARFGTSDAQELRGKVFGDAGARKDLEAILHPLIGQASRKEFARLSAEDPKRPIIYEATLLIEAGRAKDFDGLIVVESPLSERITRLKTRDGLTEEQIRKILDTQLPDSERRKHATHVLENSGTLEELKARVMELAAKIFHQS